MTDCTSFKRTVFFGLPDEVAAELCDALSLICNIIDLQVLTGAQECFETIDDATADVIFCGTDASVIRDLRRRYRQACIIAVDQIPDTGNWIDAIEAGADDYTSVPRGLVEMRWLVQSNFRTHRMAA